MCGVVLLLPRTPIDACIYFRDLANMMVGYGSKTSFMENYALVETIEAGWADHRKKKARVESSPAKTENGEDGGNAVETDTATGQEGGDDEDGKGGNKKA
eukprot:10745273-Alexandrium_andersonii.AAC.1